MSAGNKDTIKVIYLDVAFQGEAGGRLALRSRSMTFFSAFGERKANIAWNAIAEIETDLAASSSSLSSATDETCTLKIINTEKELLSFRMKNRTDLYAIQADMERQIEAYRTGAGEMAGQATFAPNPNAGKENSLINFPPFAANGQRASSDKSVTRRSGSSTVTGPNGLPSEVTVDQGDDEPSRMGITSDTVGLRGKLDASLRTHKLQTKGGDSVYAGDEMVSSQRSVCDTSTIATSVEGSVGVLSVDTEAAMSTFKDISLSEPNTFKEGNAPLYPPIATYTMVPEQATNPVKEVEHKKKMWQSTWFWLTLCLVALLLLGVGIGIGISSSSRSSSTTSNAATTTTAGLSEATTSPPVAAAFEVATVSPVDLTSAPTFASTAGCNGVAHSDAQNDRTTSIDAGNFGGSSSCRVSVWSSCQGTEWVPFSLDSGTTTAWFTATAFEDSFCPADVEHRVKLTVPSGVNYDLHVYSSGSAVAYDSSTNDSGVDEEVVIAGDDNSMAVDSFTYFILVEYRSGSSCTPWTLEISGHQCLY